MIVSQWNRSMEHGVSGQKSEEEYFDMFRSRILGCICNRIISNEPTSFQSVDMIKECARGFLNQLGVDEYQFSGEHHFIGEFMTRFIDFWWKRILWSKMKTTPSLYQ